MAMTRTAHCGLDAVELRASDGASAVVTLHGAQVVSWRAAAAGGEQLYLSPRSAYADGTAIRGGVPVVFPQFSDRGPLVRHGFARSRPWRLLHAQTGADGRAQAVLQLSDDDASRALWPHAFELELRVSVGADSLAMELSCRNPAPAALRFACALHTYLRLHTLSQAGIEGLAGRTYWDAVDARTRSQQPRLLVADGELDRIYWDVDRPLVLRDAGAPQPRSVRIEHSGFADVVVWNPGAARCAALADMPPDGYRNMVCIEAAAIGRPVTLAGGQRWAGQQRLVVQA